MITVINYNDSVGDALRRLAGLELNYSRGGAKQRGQTWQTTKLLQELYI